MGATGGPDELDAVVGRAVAKGGSVDDVAERLRSDERVASAEVRGGVVKTEPPIIELAVDFAGAAGSRVYDVVQELDGGLRLGGSHLA